nr:hypothetical protein [Paramuribaculum sp.]
MKRLFAPFLAILIALCSCQKIIANDEVKNSLAAMNKALGNRARAIKNREHREDSLRTIIANASGNDRLKATQELAFSFTAVNVDSAIKYYTLAEEWAKEMNNESARRQYQANRLSMYTFQGDIQRASTMFEQIDTAGMTHEDLREYYAAGSRLYLAFASYVSAEQAGVYLQKGKNCAIRHLELSEKDTPKYNYVEAILALLDGRQARALALASDALEHNPPESVYHTWCEELIGVIYLKEEKKDEAIIHFANAVKNDATQGFQIGNGARLLANLLILDGEFKQADKLLQTALDNALSSGDRMRFSQAVSLSPKITDRYRGTTTVSRVIICILVVLLVGFIVLAIWLNHKRNCDRDKIENLKKKLVDLGELKATYIREFLNMSAIYIEKMDDYKTYVHKKIKSGKIDEIISSLKSGEILQSQSETFYSIFDRAFLHAYPDFVKEVNELLQPDKPLVQTQPDLLTTDLRLLAFMRLGFEDSLLIARFMGLSLNTIYTYRNRLRSRAINRDTFE